MNQIKIMKHYFKNFKHICKHKWYVFIECCKEGLYWRGIVHDMSKFTLIEYKGYSNNFFKESPSERDRKDFNVAWVHHQGVNKHHWQYWWRGKAFPNTAGTIPEKYMLEMVCDWRAMSKQFNNDVTDWYYKEKEKGKIVLHPKTQKAVELLLKK